VSSFELQHNSKRNVQIILKFRKLRKRINALWSLNRLDLSVALPGKILSQVSFGFDSGTSASGAKSRSMTDCRQKENQTARTSWSSPETASNRTSSGSRSLRKPSSSEYEYLQVFFVLSRLAWTSHSANPAGHYTCDLSPAPYLSYAMLSCCLVKVCILPGCTYHSVSRLKRRGRPVAHAAQGYRLGLLSTAHVSPAGVAGNAKC